MVVTLADNSTTTVTIKNGRGITSVSKTGTSGLDDTYTISYNDGTTSTFVVKNGAKGDTGDAWYVWIRYAGQQPTQDSDMGATPDNWMGIYSGTSTTPPTHYTSYTWFQIKGEKGDTGAAASIVSDAVEYQVSNSGTVVPTGTWSSTVPAVTQGMFLWTRTTVTFNSGSPVVWYAVAYQAIDGEGSPGTATPLMDSGDGSVGVANAYSRQDHVHPTDTSRASDSELKTYVRPNLLDNAYFAGGGSQLGSGKFPINQRGQTSYNAAGYGIDRWKIDGYVTLTLNSDYITITKSDSATYRGINQRIEVSGLTGKTVTLSLLCMGGSTGDFRLTVADSNNAIIEDAYPNIEVANTEVLRSVSFTATADVLWVCLRPHNVSSLMVKAVKLELGSTQTLAHQENGAWVLNEIPNYAEELAKCRRYLQIIYSDPGTNGPLAGGYGFSSTNVRVYIPLSCPLRDWPRVSFLVGSISTVSLISDSGALSSTEVSVAYAKEGTTVILMFEVSGATTFKTYWLTSKGIKIMLSAEP